MPELPLEEINELYKKHNYFFETQEINSSDELIRIAAYDAPRIVALKKMLTDPEMKELKALNAEFSTYVTNPQEATNKKKSRAFIINATHFFVNYGAQIDSNINPLEDLIPLIETLETIDRRKFTRENLNTITTLIPEPFCTKLLQQIICMKKKRPLLKATQ